MIAVNSATLIIAGVPGDGAVPDVWERIVAGDPAATSGRIRSNGTVVDRGCLRGISGRDVDPTTLTVICVPRYAAVGNTRRGRRTADPASIVSAFISNDGAV
jgi:hypothetical protein